MRKAFLYGVIITLSLVLISGCNLFFWNRGPSLRTDLRLKTAVHPFEDPARLAGPGGGIEAAQMLAERLSANPHFVVVPWSQVEAYMTAKQIPYPLTQTTAVVVGRGLGLNGMVLGSISEISQLQKHTGLLSFIPLTIPYINEVNDVLNYVLVAKVIDSETGVVLGADVGQGETPTGLSEEEVLMGGPSAGLDQKVKAQSMGEAVDKLAEGIFEAFADVPWKGFVVQVSGQTAVLSAGSDVGIKPGDRFVVWSAGEKITNRVGQTYVVPGPVRAWLEAVTVNQSTTETRITHGTVHMGDAVQAAR
jgi:hypothetical protein